MKLNFVIAYDCGNDQAENSIHDGQHKFQSHYIGEMFGQKEVMLCNIPVVEVGDSDIQKDVEDHGKIEEGKIKAIALCSNHILNSTVDPQHPEGFDQQVQGHQ